MPAISLDELNALAALQTRRDRKYILSQDIATELVAWLASMDSREGARVLEIDGNRSSLYDSIYLDTPEMTCYRMAVQKNRRRFKVRRRTYMDSGQSFLEVKTKSASAQTVKDRVEWTHSVRSNAPRSSLVSVSLPAWMLTHFIWNRHCEPAIAAQQFT